MLTHKHSSLLLDTRGSLQGAFRAGSDAFAEDADCLILDMIGG